MQQRIPLLIYGSGGFAREVAWLVRSMTNGAQPYHVAAFIDDDARKLGTTVHGIPVINVDDAAADYAHARYVVAAGDPATRERMTERADGAGLHAGCLIHPSALY